MLQRGLPAGSTVLLLGPPGSGKSTLARQFLHEAAIRGAEAILLSTSDSRELVKQSMLTFGWDPENVERIKVIDCYSWKQGIKSTEKSREKALETIPLNLRNLTDVSVALTEFFDSRTSKNPCFVIDSFTDFLLNHETEAVLRFLGQMKSRLQARGVTTLLLLEDGIHESTVVSTTEYLADGTIRAEFDETKRRLRVSRMVATPLQLGWSEFKITRGIEVTVKDFFGSSEAK